MRARGIILTIVVILGVVFAILNWNVLVAPIALNLIFLQLQWPLGITLLAAVVAVALVFFLVSLLERAAQLRHVTGMQRQLDSTRARLDDRRGEHDQELARRLDTGLGELQGGVEERLERMRQALESQLDKRLQAHEARLSERLDALSQRVIAVRDELAAGLAETERAAAQGALPVEREAEA